MAEIPLPGFLPAELAPGGLAPGQEDAEAAQAPCQPEGDNRQAQLEALWLRREQEQQAQWRARVESWREETARDAELGGERFESSVARAQLALARFDQGGKIGRLLEASGYGNHPDIVRFFNRLADAVMEDVPAPGSADAGLAPLEERMYAHWRS